MAIARFSLFLSTLLSFGISAQVIRQFPLTDSLEEVSGMATDGEYIWMINDSGNEPLLFEYKGDVFAGAYPIVATNTDWEALTRDVEGNLYIADIGNNANTRYERTVYFIPRAAINHQYKPIEPTVYPIYSPIAPPYRNNQLDYDWESMIWYGGKLHFFSKNRREPFDGTIIHYTSEEIYTEADTLQAVDSTNYGQLVREFFWITDATLSKNRRHLFLLSSDKIIAYLDFPGSRFFEGYQTTIPLGTITQKESITALNDTILLVADEKNLLLNALGGQSIYVINIASELDDYLKKRKYEVQVEEKIIDSTLTLHLNPLVTGSLILEIFDENGKVIHAANYGELTANSDSVVEIDFSDFPVGMYIVNARIGRMPHGFFISKRGKWKPEESDASVEGE